MNRTESQSGNSTRTPATISARLNKGLAAYVAAASAAGVGLLAGAQPADAEVVYTPANTPILINTPVALDLNNDGVVDFQLSNNYGGGFAKSCTICSFFEHASLKATPAQAGNGAWGINSASHHRGDARRKSKNRVEEVAAPVFWGVVVGPERPFQAAGLVMDSTNATQSFGGGYSTNSIGEWGRGRAFTGPYLGLKFTVGGEVHYGWARIKVSAHDLTITATLTGFAYETVPGRGIITGATHGSLDADAEASARPAPAAEPVSLGRLAQGATGVPAWRASQTVAQNVMPVSGK